MEKIDLNGKTVLVTGAAGFIGSNLVKRLFKEMSSGTIVGIDNMNSYYEVSLKEYRLQELSTLHSQTSNKRVSERRTKLASVMPSESGSPKATLKPQTSNLHYQFVKGDIADKPTIDALFAKYHFDIVVNLAAQAGVRYSIENPDAYIQSNMIGFYNILEACRHSTDQTSNLKQASKRAQNEASFSYGERERFAEGNSQTSNHQGVQHLVYASSSSVYGGNKKVPFSTDDRVDNPVSLYAATKKSNELFAHCYSKLYNIPTTGLRFFTVYGPAGRPDMAYFGFTNKLLKGDTIQIFNYGNCRRDFTYIDDIVEGILRVMKGAPERKLGEDGLPIPPYAVYNIGGGQPESLLDFVQILQEELLNAGVLPQDYDFEAHKKLVPMQPGDVPTTYADSTALERDFGFTPKITLREGLRNFAQWYKSYYK